MPGTQPQLIEKIQDIALHPQMVPVTPLQSALGIQGHKGGANRALDRDFIGQGDAKCRRIFLGIIEERSKTQDMGSFRRQR